MQTGFYSNPGAGTAIPEFPLHIYSVPTGRYDSQHENPVVNTPRVRPQPDQTSPVADSGVWYPNSGQTLLWGKPLLSILIPTTPGRRLKFTELINMLNAQRNALPNPDLVEIVTLEDDGTLMVGAKRNRLMDMAKGEYLCFFDDDDEPFGGYLRRILEALESRPDVVGITIFWTDQIFDAVRLLVRSLDYQKFHWLVKNDAVTCGRPAHLNPTRSSIAKTVRFNENVIAGEDAEWSAAVACKLKTCVNIDEPIYWYNFQKQGTLTQRPGAREAMRPPLPLGHQYAFRDGKVVELNERGVVVVKEDK